jgi:hypothetical protein
LGVNLKGWAHMFVLNNAATIKPHGTNEIWVFLQVWLSFMKNVIIYDLGCISGIWSSCLGPLLPYFVRCHVVHLMQCFTQSFLPRFMVCSPQHWMWTHGSFYLNMKFMFCQEPWTLIHSCLIIM